ncbi:MAG: hypothetical protein OXE99_03825 [Cellvibrionales bacterium]|nr:hypothetical protein [Cellvibrionales bacterium]
MQKLFLVLLSLCIMACNDDGLHHQSHEVTIEQLTLSVTSGQNGVVEPTQEEGKHSLHWKVATENIDNRYIASLYLSQDAVLDPVEDLKLIAQKLCTPNSGNLTSKFCASSSATCTYNNDMLLSCAFTSGDFSGNFSTSLSTFITVSEPFHYLIEACHFKAPEVCTTRSVQVTFM